MPLWLEKVNKSGIFRTKDMHVFKAFETFYYMTSSKMKTEIYD